MLKKKCTLIKKKKKLDTISVFVPEELSESLANDTNPTIYRPTDFGG